MDASMTDAAQMRSISIETVQYAPHLLCIDYERIRRIATPERVIEAVRAGFAAQVEGRVRAAPISHLRFEDPPGDCHVKWGHEALSELFVIKIATGFHANPREGLPSGLGLMLVLCARTGQPLALLQDQGWLTDARTAAAAVLALETAGFEAGEPLGVLGTGIQAKLNARWAASALSAGTVYLWGRRYAAAELCKSELEADGIQVVLCDTPAHVASACRAIVSCTPSTQPLLRARDVQVGTILIALGADTEGKQELHTDIVPFAQRILCDDIAQCFDHGELQHSKPTERAIEVLGRAERLPGERRTTLVDLTGIPAQDIAVASLIYRTQQAGP
jgi:ornithine cyclodeaminase